MYLCHLAKLYACIHKCLYRRIHIFWKNVFSINGLDRVSKIAVRFPSLCLAVHLRKQFETVHNGPFSSL